MQYEMSQSSCDIEKKIFFISCITRRIMKKESNIKREKISSERRRLVEELHALVRRNIPRRRVIVRGYNVYGRLTSRCSILAFQQKSSLHTHHDQCVE